MFNDLWETVSPYASAEAKAVSEVATPLPMKASTATSKKS